jgi:hypothetical protein
MDQDDIPTETIAVPSKDPEAKDGEEKKPVKWGEKPLENGKSDKKDDEIVSSKSRKHYDLCWLLEQLTAYHLDTNHELTPSRVVSSPSVRGRSSAQE